MSVNYLVRLDDACPQMSHKNWTRIEDILDRHKVLPLVGVIPNNEDLDTTPDIPDPSFWQKVKIWEEKGWKIALHGHNHVCSSVTGGINPVHNRSEFAGLSIESQERKFFEGYEVFKKHNIFPSVFFAPSHTYDINTILALKSKTPIRIVSDTFALKPYKQYGMIFIPQQMGRFRKILISGYWTFCFHPNNMLEKDFYDFEIFIKKNRNNFIAFKDIPLNGLYEKTLLDRCLNRLYFLIRNLHK